MLTTYNLNGKSPSAYESNGVNYNDWLFKNDQFFDFYVIGFQEMVDLNAANVVLNLESSSRAKEWNPLLLSVLNNRAQQRNAGCQYFEIASQTLVGVHIVVYAKLQHRQYISSVHTQNAAVGIAGVLGNKGGSAIRFRFKDNTFCFICSHLVRVRHCMSKVPCKIFLFYMYTLTTARLPIGTLLQLETQMCSVLWRNCPYTDTSAPTASTQRNGTQLTEYFPFSSMLPALDCCTRSITIT